MIKARQHSNRKLVWKVPHGLLGAVAERQMRVRLSPEVDALLMSALARDPFFVLITVFAAGLSVWAFRLLQMRAR
mgnify:CR=1 FL=1